MNPRYGRRFQARLDHLQAKFGVSRELAILMLTKDRRRVHFAAVDRTPPAELVREIRHDVAGAVRL